MTHPYKRTAYFAGAATLALAVAACGNDGDMSDVLQGSGTASAVSGGTTASQTKTESVTETEESSDKAADRWLGDGESLTVEIRLLKQGEVTPEVIMDSLTVSNARVETNGYNTDVCYDVSAHYKETKKSKSGIGFDSENPDISSTTRYAAASVFQYLSLGFDKDPENAVGFAEQLKFDYSSQKDVTAAFDLEKGTYSTTLCVHADTIDDFSKLTVHASLSTYGEDANTSSEDKDVIGWELGSPKTA